MAVKAVPEGYHTVTPYLIVGDGAAAIAFYQRAFGAEEVVRMADPSGKIGHAELQIGSSRIMLADEFPEMGNKSPRSLGGSPVGMCIYAENVDGLYSRAVAAGATVERPLQDQWYGDRSGTVRDPFGHQWTLATHIEDVTPEEMARRMKAAMPA